MSDPGTIVLFSSGESGPHARKVYEWLFRTLPPPLRVAILETPAGFEPNSAQVAGRIAAYLQRHLQGFHPACTIVAARQRGTPFSPDEPAIVAPLLEATAMVMGPGSPSYAVRQLRGSLAWEHLLARHRAGAALLLSSAAAIAASALALPVYEIYKVGEALHWKAGLNLFGLYGLSLAIVPHWDNSDSASVDTSRCYMGLARFEVLSSLLPAGCTVVGLDEHTALTIEPASGLCRVMGLGCVTVIEQGQVHCFASGECFPAQRLGPFHLPERATVPEPLPSPDPRATPPAQVLDLLNARQDARAQKAWALADALRAQIASLGWRVQDTSDGSELIRAEPPMESNLSGEMP